MGRFIKALQAGVRAAVRASTTHTGRFASNGKEIICLHCGGETFTRQFVALHPSMLIGSHYPWNDRTATMLICQKCSHIEWFARSPDLQS